MRCRPGDVAFIVRTEDGTSGPQIGKPVQVLHLRGEHSQHGPIWRIRSSGAPLLTIHGTASMECDHPDAWLQPIRDPGSDAVDETLALQWKRPQVQSHPRPVTLAPTTA